MRRNKILDEIRQLDPVTDHQRIVFLTDCYEFPFDTTRSLELALFRTFAISKGTPLLLSTEEFTRRTQKRYDDTYLILAEMLEHGYDSPRGRAALRQMNRLHHRYPIPNDEYLYTLSVFVFEQIRWNARFGWRPFMEQEKLAIFHWWREVGRRMNIKSLPTDFDEFERFNVAYEQEHFSYAEANHQLACATRDMFLGWFLPKPLWPLGAPFIYAVMDDRLLEAVGFPKPAPTIRRLVEGALKLRGRIVRLMPPRQQPYSFTHQRMRTYPEGYEIEQLGPRLE